MKYLLIQSSPYFGEAYNTLSMQVMKVLIRNLETRYEILDLSKEIDQKYAKSQIDSCDKYIFFLPEYNGSFPGSLKLLMDQLPIEIWKNKKALLVGYSGGQFGNVRGMSHLTDILNYLKVNVFCDKLSIPNVRVTLDDIEKSHEVLTKLNEYVIRFTEF